LDDETYKKISDYIKDIEQNLNLKIKEIENPEDKIKEEMNKLGRYFLMREFITNY
jgi:hypothetical protein